MTGLLGQSRLFVVLGRERLLPARLATVSQRTGMCWPVALHHVGALRMPRYCLCPAAMRSAGWPNPMHALMSLTCAAVLLPPGCRHAGAGHAADRLHGRHAGAAAGHWHPGGAGVHR